MTISFYAVSIDLKGISELVRKRKGAVCNFDFFENVFTLF